jgi:predicted aconitase
VRAPGIQKGNIDDSFYPLLGYQVGNLATSQIPVVVGLESLNPTLDDLKAFGAAFATVSSAPMFHMVGVTPEAPTLETVLSQGPDVRTVDVHLDDLIECWNSLNSATDQQPTDLVSLGNPHFSLAEITKLASLCKGRTKDKDVAVMVTCGRVTYASACKSGLTDELEAFGVQFITDTCWCMITEPTIPESQYAIMTNSGKYAHYGPGLTGKSFYFGSLARCVEAACGSENMERRPQWFESGPQ